MEVPPLASVEGAYWYLIAIIAIMALASGLYILGVILGYLPDPPGLFYLVPGGLGWTGAPIPACRSQ